MAATRDPGLFLGHPPVFGSPLEGTTHYGRIAAEGWKDALAGRDVAIAAFPWGTVDERFVGEEGLRIEASHFALNPFCPLLHLLFKRDLWTWAQEEGHSLVVLLPLEEPEWCDAGPDEGTPTWRLVYMLLRRRAAVVWNACLQPQDIQETSFAFSEAWKQSPTLFGTHAFATLDSRPSHATNSVEATLEREFGHLPKREPPKVEVVADEEDPPAWMDGLEQLRKAHPEAFSALDGLRDGATILRTSPASPVGLGFGARVGAGALYVLFADTPATADQVKGLTHCIERLVGALPLEPPGHPLLPLDITLHAPDNPDEGGALQLRGTNIHGHPYPALNLGPAECHLLWLLDRAEGKVVRSGDLMYAIYKSTMHFPEKGRPLPDYLQLHALRRQAADKLRKEAGVAGEWIDAHLVNTPKVGYALLRDPRTPKAKPGSAIPAPVTDSEAV